jgi:hypothetical protein
MLTMGVDYHPGFQQVTLVRKDVDCSAHFCDDAPALGTGLSPFISPRYPLPSSRADPLL